jgi:hypothetical protein
LLHCPAAVGTMQFANSGRHREYFKHTRQCNVNDEPNESPVQAGMDDRGQTADGSLRCCLVLVLVLVTNPAVDQIPILCPRRRRRHRCPPCF